MVDNWQRISHRQLADYRVMRLRQDTSRSPRTGCDHEFYVMEMPGWINIVPVTSQGRVVMIRQYRHGTRSLEMEIPGGMAEVGDQSLAVAAARELEEETGYRSAEVLPLGHVAPNPAIQDNFCHTFLAIDARPCGPQTLDAGEDVEIVEVDLAEIPGLIERGTVRHALVVVAFYWFDQYRLNHPNFLAGAPDDK